eukprot:2029279-Pyramimonas_sp.AAC.1
MIDNSSQDLSPATQSGYANIWEAAMYVDVVINLTATMRDSCMAIKVIGGVLHGGWPQTKTGFAASERGLARELRTAPTRGIQRTAAQGAPSGAPDKPRNRSPIGSLAAAASPQDPSVRLTAPPKRRQRQDLARCVFAEHSTDDNCLGTGQLFPSTVDSGRGGEADVVIYLATRSNFQYDWGFMDKRNCADVAVAR